AGAVRRDRGRSRARRRRVRRPAPQARRRRRRLHPLTTTRPGSMKKNLTIAVTGLNATDNPAPGVGVLRALQAANPRDTLIGLAYDALDPGIYARDLAAEVFLIPYPSHGVDAFLDRLEYVH